MTGVLDWGAAMDNLMFVMGALFAILVFFGVLILNISRELNKQFYTVN